MEDTKGIFSIKTRPFSPPREKYRRIGRADIEESKSDVAMNAWPPQASYPCGNFSDTSGLNIWGPKGSLGLSFHCFRMHWTRKSNQLLPLNSTSGFRPLWADLGSPVLSFNRCAAPAKLPVRHCQHPSSHPKVLNTISGTFEFRCLPSV